MSDEKSQDRRPKHTEAGPDIAPRARDEMLEAYHERREDEPAAAPMETDAESGGASAVSDLPAGKAPEDPAQRYINSTETPRRDNANDSVGGTAWIAWVIAALICIAVVYGMTQL